MKPTINPLALAQQLAVRELQPGDAGGLANVANAARDAGDHALARRVYAELLERLPNHPVVRRNYLVGLE